MPPSIILNNPDTSKPLQPLKPDIRRRNSKNVSEPDFYATFSKENQENQEDLHTLSTQEPQGFVLLPSLNYLVYIHRVLRNLITTLLFEWSMPIFDPFNFLLLVTVFPTFIVGIILLEISLNIGFKFGLGTFIQEFEKKWGAGLSLVNIWDPRIFTHEVDEIVKNGIKALNTPLPPPLPEEQLDESRFGGVIQTRGFDLDMAELLLFMSSIIYERENELVRKAHESMKQITKNSKTVNSIPAEEIDSVTSLLRKSEKRIHEQAKMWGLKFTSLSELNSLGGPFSGMFWSEKYDFIVIVFKGTTPINFGDFVVDLMFQRVDARSFVFGEVHEGFYTSLFPQIEYSTRSSHSSPYVTIIRAIRSKAAEIKALRPEKKINVWITGHSLGAALASLFYSRLMKCPEDLGPNCILRDGYVFGCPSVGDAEFAAEFASYSNTPYDRRNTLWRIIDDTDIITKLPPGLNDPSVRRVIKKNSILNYVHVGEGIRFFHDGKRPALTKNLFYSGKEPVIIERDHGNYRRHEWGRPDDDEKKLHQSNAYELLKHKPGSPLPFIEKCLPTFFKNHLPARYFAVMQKARIYFDEEN